MSRNKNKKKKGAGGDGFIGRLFANTKLPAHVTEENDWYLDTPDVRLTRVFAIVLILHVVAVGGILAFKMVEKAAGPEVVGRAETATPVVAEAAPAPPAAAPVVAPPVEEPTPKTESAPQAATEKAVIHPHPSLENHSEYRVRASDSLTSIARSQGISVQKLRELNNLGSGDRIYVGKWLVVPGTTKETTKEVAKKEVTPVKAPTVAAAQKPAPTSTGDSYQVQVGDTFYAISRKFGVPYQKIMSHNGITSPQDLKSGMTLSIPTVQ